MRVLPVIVAMAVTPEAICESKRQNQGSNDADPRPCAQEESGGRAGGYDGNPGPNRS
ncbi:hypothetical protein LAUMK191_01001 [Mycobacterium attenuatum]|uniref:Uncharacterized protein n=1 Tax=Mycobacterium attenuatum TaxID=2341086 RepID=A0A498PTJ4_9MYCO|nr:hypothetical protein LAUMK136_01004 [Mycobacterium attenuatum]VBA47885.1 hypothetical protein LAUMK191_01001 [Mycobacterium attenuatum]VBA52026.1 hypothetical protein LAUMK41_01089 [Mycobacterium attenuatum]